MKDRILHILIIAFLPLCFTGCKYSFSDGQLDAFRQKNDSMATSIKHLQKKIERSFSVFETTTLKREQGRAKFPYERAMQIRQYAETLEKEINKLKDTLIDAGGGIVASRGDVKARNNIYLSRHLMVDQGRAGVLKSRIEETRSRILALFDLEQSEPLKMYLQSDDPKDKSGLNKTWEAVRFGKGIPLTEAITNLTAIQLDLKQLEAQSIKMILGK